MQSVDVSIINIKIEVVNSELLFGRVKLLKAKDDFDELSNKLANISLNDNKKPDGKPKHMVVPSDPLLSQKEVTILFQVVQYKN